MKGKLFFAQLKSLRWYQYASLLVALHIFTTFIMNCMLIIDIVYDAHCIPTTAAAVVFCMAPCVLITTFLFMRNGFPDLHFRWLGVFPIIAAGIFIYMFIGRDQTYGCLYMQLFTGIAGNALNLFLIFSLRFHSQVAYMKAAEPFSQSPLPATPSSQAPQAQYPSKYP